MVSIYSITKAEMNDESSTKTISSTTIIKDDVKLKELKRKQKNKKYKFTEIQKVDLQQSWHLLIVKFLSDKYQW